MKTISPYDALRENEYVVATVKKPRNDINVRYGDTYEVCATDFGGVA